MHSAVYWNVLFSTATLEDVNIKHFNMSYRDKFKDSNFVQDHGRMTKG